MGNRGYFGNLQGFIPPVRPAPPHTPRADMESAPTVGVGVPDDPRTFIAPPTPAGRIYASPTTVGAAYMPPGHLPPPQTSRSGQDRSLRAGVNGRFVGRGLDPAVAVPAAAGLNHTPPPQTKIPRAYAARGTGKILLPAYTVTPPRRPSGRPRGRCSPTSRQGPRGPCGRRRPAGGRWACAGQGRG